MGAAVKLLNQSSRYYLLSSLVVFTIIGMVLFYALRFTLDYNTGESLRNTRRPLARHLLQLDELQPTMYIMDEIIELRPIAAVTEMETYQDTAILVVEADGEVELEPFRKYTYDELVNGTSYRISISLSTVENGDLIGTLLLVVLSGLMLFLLAVNLLNRYLSRQLWRPFYRTLTQLKTFSVQQNNAPAFPPSQTKEFNDLNQSLEAMTGQLVNEYESLRRFTENASHELQTPLAVIRNQIDLLLRGGERSEEDYVIIQRLSESVSKLGKLNQSLLLLTKIERGQVPDAEWVGLQPLVEHKLEQLAPGLKNMSVELKTSIEPTAIRMPLLLVDVLLNNLLGNAVRHNVRGGQLGVFLSSGKLEIENSGEPLEISPDVLFERFRKESKSADSLGLGLAIVREICDKYGCGLQYHHHEGIHRLTLSFGVNKTGS